MVLGDLGNGIKEVMFGSAEAKDHDNRKWLVRSTLMRMKRPDKVVHNAYEIDPEELPKTKTLSTKSPPPSPFKCASGGALALNDECTVCFPQYFPASLSVDDAQAQALITAVVDSIKTDLAILRATLGKHADFLVSRWKKKSREKRFTFLTANTHLIDKKWAGVHLINGIGDPTQARPGGPMIPHERRLRSDDGRCERKLEMRTMDSLVEAFVREQTLTSNRDSWFLPYLDAETLSEDPELFLSLLYHRTANDPEKWLMFDNANIIFVEQFCIMPSTFNRNCVVTQGPDYGKLVKWNAEQAHHWEVVGFTKAHILLTAQKTMMTLLSKCVKGLLAEANTPPILELHPKWDSMIASDFSRFKTNFQWSTDFVKPFSAPPKFDAREVAELITSRHRVILDELELLQTDPQYVQSLSKEISACQFFETWRQVDIMPWIVDYLFFSTMHRESYWRQLAAESEQMIKFFDIFEQDPSKQAKQNLDQAIYIVYDLCLETFAIFEPQVQTGLLIQRGFERNFTFTGSAKTVSTNRGFLRKDCFTDDLLYWSMNNLGYDENRPFTMDPSFHFAIIDHLCRTDPKEADRISQTMLDRLSDMSILTEIMSSIRSDMTRNRAVSPQVTKIFATKSHTTAPDDWIKKINADHGKELGDTLGPSLLQLLQKFPWPGGKKDLKWLEKANASRACLTKFWAKYKLLWAQKLGEAKVSQRLINEDLKLLRATSSERYKEGLAHEKQFIQELVSQSSGSSDDGQKEVQTVWGKENDSRASLPTRSKAKVSTSAESTAVVDAEKIRTPLVVPATKIITLPSFQLVKHDNLVVFQHMFPLRGAESQRSFSWQHFLGAMVDAGFGILQSQGSAITLKLDNDTCSGVKTIVLHRPHPSPTVNPVMLRRIAKRMEKWFGWHREMFVERSK